jgi:hypothetical protein
MGMKVDTKRVAGRRALHFETLDNIVRDAQMLASRRASTIGNWTLAQIFEHLAKSTEASLDGVKERPSLFLRLFARVLKKRFLTKPMPSGFTLPRNLQAELLPSDQATTEAFLARLRAAVDRTKSESHREPQVIFGRIPVQENNQIHLRLAEMHLSFAVAAE